MLNICPNFLSEDVLKSLTDKFQSSKGKDVFEANHMGRWGAGLESGSYAPVLILRLEEYKEYFLNLYPTVDPAFADFKNLTVFMHVWLPGTQINWHHDASDNSDRLSSTIYISPTWNWNWGGLFIYDDAQLGQGWIYPHYNKMIWFKPPVWHATTMVSATAPEPRLSVQLFFSR